MNRVCVLGCSGAGKTTLAGEIAARTGLPWVSLDAHFWQPGWVEMPRDKWHRTHADLIAQERWVIDGNFFNTLEARLAVADTAVFVDLPAWRCFFRVLRRSAGWWGRSRPDMGPGCYERFDPSFLHYVWHFDRNFRPWLVDALARYPDLRVIPIHDNRERVEFLDSL
jgi:adenylate kinase family enzyme